MIPQETDKKKNQEIEKNEEKNLEVSRVQDTDKTKQIEDILNKVRIGKKVNQEDIGADPRDEFLYPWFVS